MDDLLEADALAQNDFRLACDSLATDKIHERGGAPGEARPFAASQKTKMSDDVTGSIQAGYDQLAGECARRIFNELQYMPLDRKLLDRFATEVSGHGEECDMGPAMRSCANRICGGALFPWMFFYFSLRKSEKAGGLAVEEMIEREPYAPEVEYQSRRAYIFARIPGSVWRRKPTPVSQGREANARHLL